MQSLRFAVLDFETTGLIPGRDRVVELAVVHLDGTGQIHGSWETLVNPARDLGAQRIHGIRAADILDAPPFEAVADRLLELLDRRVLVGHNVSFDARFLRAEFERTGIELLLDKTAQLCTMRLARFMLQGAGRSLADCCDAFDIALESAHRASADALATAHLLSAYLEQEPDPAWWKEQAPRTLQCRQRIGSKEHRWLPRPSPAHAELHFLERLTCKLPSSQALPEEEEAYLALLDRSLLDRFLSEHEEKDLVQLASELGLDRSTCLSLHLQYFEGLARAAWEDKVLTQEERADLQQVASLLGIPEFSLHEALERPRPEWLEPAVPQAEPGAFRLTPGDHIVLTGDMRRSRGEWQSLILAEGYVPWAGVTKKVKLVAAADPDSLSGKARKAREYGIPIVSEAGLEALLGLQ